ncbi:hypothetical protein GY45DRAFT_236905 [Cubamyces sp. BRFM 1775]|nr:hypothetical protein GY45DRAFT_236905 [Cubamyces sp. BRFM 1775]
MPIATEVSPAHPATPTLRRITTQDLQRGSPAPRFEVEKPRGRSLSPVRSRASAGQANNASSASASASTSAPTPTAAPAVEYVAPPLTWRTAAQDAKAGIHYTKDEFPSSSSSFLPPPFSREPVQVKAGDRVELLEEVDEYAVRVRVLRTGKVGLIPAWNTEGALDRLTRINTAFNEAATCPAEAHTLRRRFSESSAMHTSAEGGHHASSSEPAIAHIHARCIPFAARVRYGDYYANPSAYDDCSSDSDDPDSPQTPAGQGAAGARGRPLHAEPGVYREQSCTLEKGGLSPSQESPRPGSGGRKSVVFPSEERPQVVFRYPSEELVEAFKGEYHERWAEAQSQDGAAVGADLDSDDDEWWWHGWEEPLEELEAEMREAEDEERGRARGEKMVGVVDAQCEFDEEDTSPGWLGPIQEEL